MQLCEFPVANARERIAQSNMIPMVVFFICPRQLPTLPGALVKYASTWLGEPMVARRGSELSAAGGTGAERALWAQRVRRSVENHKERHWRDYVSSLEETAKRRSGS